MARHAPRSSRLALPVALLLWLPLLSLVPSQPARAQWAPTRSFSGNDGLAQSQITALAQDSYGYLWVGTQGGLSRFDGHSFTTFTTSDGLPDDVVTALDAAGDGSLALGTDSGAVARWNGRSFDTLVSRLDGHRQHITAVRSLSPSTILVGTKEALYLLEGESYSRLLEEPVGLLLTGWDGKIWVLAGSKPRDTDTYRTAVSKPRLYRYLGEAGQAGELVAAMQQPAIAIDEVTAGATIGEVLWFAGGDDTIVRLSQEVTAHFAGPPGEEIQTLLPRVDGSVWIGTSGGLWLLTTTGDLLPQTLDPALGKLPVSTLLLDHERNLWIGIWTQGLYQQTPNAVTLFTTDSGLPSPTVWAMTEDRQGCVWLGTDPGGIAVWCQDGWRQPLTTHHGLLSNRIMCLRAASDGSIWIGTVQGLSRRRPDGSLTTWTSADGLPHDFIRGVAEDRQGRIWVATSDGVARWDGRRWSVWRDELGRPAGIVRTLTIDQQGAVWLATHSEGVLRIDGDQLQAFTTTDGLPSDRVWFITTDSRGWIWAGTDFGIWVRRGDTSPSTIIGEEDGLPSKNIVYLVEDTVGFMWVGTNQGVTRIDPERMRIHPVPAYESFMRIEANENACLLDSTGHLWLGMTQQVVRFDPRHLPRNEIPPPIVLERVVVDGKPCDEPSCTTLTSGISHEQITLGPSVHELRFEYAALSFMAPPGNRYRVMLEGYDPALSWPTDENHATYRNVPPGHYRFKMTACNNDGVWAESPVVLPIYLQPRWYQTLVVRIGTLLLAVAIGLTWLVRRLAAEKRLQRRLEKQVAHRTAELEQANEQIQAQNRLLEELSRTDPLTGLANRRVLADQLPTEMALLRREISRKSPGDLARYHTVSILMMDLDGFKTINDRWGHDTGDTVLRRISDNISAILRDEVDLAVRWGGDELVVMARGVDRTGAEQIVRRLLQCVAETRFEAPDGEAFSLSVSIGFITYPLGLDGFLAGGQWHLLVDAADHLMYLAKERGRSRAFGLAWRPLANPTEPEVETVARIITDPCADHPGLELVELHPGTTAAGS